MCGRVLSIAALFAVNMLLDNRLTDAEFSAYLLASFLVPFLALLGNLGTPEILMRDVRRSLVAGDVARARRLVLSCMAICAAASLAVGAVLFAASQFVHTTKPHWQELQNQVGPLALWLVFQTLCQVAGEACRGCDRFALSGAIYTKSGGWLVNSLSAALVFALWPQAKPADFTQVMLVQVLATAIPAVYGFWALARILVRPPAAQTAGLTERLDEPFVATTRWMVRESWPIFVSYFVIIGIEQLDILMVAYFCSDSDVADYGVAKRWLSLINFAFVTLAPAITPFIAELQQRGDMPKLKRLMRGSATIVAIPTIVMCIALLAGAEWALHYTFPQRVGAAAPLRILLIGQVLLSLAGHSYVALSMTGHQRSLMICSLWVGVLFLGLGPLSTYWWGVNGAATAKSIATAARAVGAAILVRIHLGFWSTASISPAALWETCDLILKRGRWMIGGRQMNGPASAPGTTTGEPPR